jgi:hypothetical protein
VLRTSLLVCALVGGVSAQDLATHEVTRQERAGHEAMLKALEEVRDRTPDENKYLGTARVRKLLDFVKRYPDERPREKAVQVYDQLGLNRLRDGENEQAVDDLKHALALLRDVPSAKRRDKEIEVHYHLGVAYMRWGETRNCVQNHNADSCLLPIRDGGVHVDQAGSRGAIEHFEKVIQYTRADDPYHVASRWLVNVMYMTIGGYPQDVPEDVLIDPEVFTTKIDFPRFPEVATDLGLDTFNLSGSAIAEDFDRDGDLDLLTSTWDTAGPLHYFRKDGDTFNDVTTEAGLDGLLGGLNMNQADYNDDGWVDVLVLRGAWIGATGRYPNSLLRNNGDGTFVDVTFAAGMTEHYPTQTGAWADYDRDGDLDLLAGAESNKFHPFPCQLYRNEGDGTFVEVAAEAGVENYRYTKAITWGDIDLDGYPEAYMSNLSQPNRLYKNEGDGTFVDVAEDRGVALPIDSFPSWFFDFDNDGAIDIFVSGYYAKANQVQLAATVASYLDEPHSAPTPRIYKGDGQGNFDEVGSALGVKLVNYPMGANFGDLNNDGFLDVYLGTGFPAYDGLMPNVVYLNLAGKRFEDVTFSGGFGHLQKGHGVVFADLDGDGDQDVFEQMGGAWLGDGYSNVYFQNPGFGNNWVQLELVGVDSPRCAIGARIKLIIKEGEQLRAIYKHVNSGGSFGASPLVQQIGVGQAVEVERLEILWPTTGKTQVFQDVPVGRHVVITEGVSELGFAFE